VQQAAERLDHARSRLRLLTPTAQIEQGYLRLDDFSNRLASALRASLQLRRQQLADARVRQARHSPETRVQLESQRLLALWKRLQSVSPASVLNRGFTIIRGEDNRPVSRRAGVRAGQKLTVEFADGTAPLRAE
jgi:exodeoxyribonuclease VII large subunit